MPRSASDTIEHKRASTNGSRESQSGGSRNRPVDGLPAHVRPIAALAFEESLPLRSAVQRVTLLHRGRGLP